MFYAPAVIPFHGVGCPHVTLSPALNCGGLARTTDQGYTWSGILPAGIDGPNSYTHAVNDFQLYSDKRTGRLFWSVPTFEATEVMWTQDDGTTWSHALLCCGAQENPEFVSAPAPAGGTQPSGYPMVVYLCTNFGVLDPPARACQKSLDGGSTWVLDGQGLLESQPIPQHPQCGTSGENISPGSDGYPVALSDGSLVAVLNCGTTNILVRSSNEGATWPFLRTVPHYGVLRSDSANDLYLMWSGPSGQLLLSISKDLGATWSAPINAAPPHVSAQSQPSWRFSVSDPGRLAVAYLGQAQGATGYDGYLTETWNALAGDPVFYAGVLNDPSHPLMYNIKPSQPWIFDDFSGVDFAPDGSVWASFLQDCGAAATDPGCRPAPPGRTTDATVGFAGRLVGAP